MGVAKVRESGPSRITFTTRSHELEVVDIGAGVAVIIPEWDGDALVLTKDDANRLRLLLQSVVERA